MEHDLRYSTGQVKADGGKVLGTVRQDVDEPRDAAVHGAPIIHGRSLESRGVRDGRDVQQEICRAAAGRMHGDRVGYRILGNDVGEFQFAAAKSMRASAE
jgi:hypothetical protein